MIIIQLTDWNFSITKEKLHVDQTMAQTLWSMIVLLQASFVAVLSGKCTCTQRDITQAISPSINLI